MARALGVFTGPEAEVEAQLGQVGDVLSLWIKGGDSCGHDGLDDAQEDGFPPLDWGIVDQMGLSWQADASLGVRGLYGVG